MQDEVRRVAVEDSVNGYLLDIIQATPRLPGTARRREHPRRWPVSRRAGGGAGGRPRYVVPDDVKSLAVPVLAHRVITKGYLHGDQREAVEALIERLVEDVPVPA